MDADPVDSALAANRQFAAEFPHAGLSTRPSKRLAILCCMDSRIDVFGALGLDLGQAHIVRNAGGLATDDAIRSLTLSHWALGTEQVLVIQHTRCGLEGLDEAGLSSQIRAAGGEPPDRFGAFDDVRASVSATVSALRSTSALAGMKVRGCVYDVDTGALSEVAV